jgi:hypothetical protein
MVSAHRIAAARRFVMILRHWQGRDVAKFTIYKKGWELEPATLPQPKLNVDRVMYLSRPDG